MRLMNRNLFYLLFLLAYILLLSVSPMSNQNPDQEAPAPELGHQQ